MKHETFKTIITMHAPRQQTIRPAEAFWSECKQHAQQQSDAAPLSSPSSFSFRIRGFYPAFASFASAAALVILYFSLVTTPKIHRAVKSFQFGEALAHNGAVVLNDNETDATILWIMTTDTEEDPL